MRDVFHYEMSHVWIKQRRVLSVREGQKRKVDYIRCHTHT